MIRGAIPVVGLLWAASVTIGGCGSAGQSASPSGATATVVPTTPAATPSFQASEPASSSGPLAVAFETPVPKKSWGAPPFKVKATASDGTAVTYSANGACSVKPKVGEVTVNALGTCTITATVVDSEPPVTADQSFTVSKATPVVVFDNSSTRFARPFKFRVPVTVTPAIDLKMTVVKDDPRGDNDDFCAIADNAFLVFDPRPTASNFPQIPAKCVVRVSAPGTSNYEAVKPTARVVTINLAAFDLNVKEVITVDFSETGGVARFPVQEGSGDAFGIDVYSNGDADVGEDNYLCDPASTSPNPAPARTTRYSATVNLQAPPGGAYDCEMTVQASPPDYQGGTFQDNFTIHVVP